MTTQLTRFDGKEVVGTAIKVTRAGDGLSAALTVEPAEFHHGDIVNIVLRCEVSKVEFVPVKDTALLSRVHTLTAGLATIVDDDLVNEVLDQQKRKIEEALGVQRLDLDLDKENLED